MKDFASRFKYALEMRNMTQGQLCAQTGVDKGSVSNYATGRYKPSGKNIVKIAAALRVSPSWLAGMSDEMEAPTDGSMARPRSHRIPVLGNVAAGIPIEMILDMTSDEWEDLTPEQMRNGGEYIALKIHGASMEPRMKNGDVVIVHIQDDVDDGQIAIVCVGNETATCKLINKTPEGISLVSLNTLYYPRFVTNEQIKTAPVRIIGRVVELRAKL